MGPVAAEGIQQTVLDGSLLLAVPLAVAAGLVSFLSPCVLPLVPGYLGYVTGLSGVDLEAHRRGRMVAGIGLFVLGFTAVYVLVGATAGALGGLLASWSDGLTRMLGLLTVVLGLVYLGVLPLLGGEHRLDLRPVAGLAGAPLLGAVFALGWTACTGPTLSVILALSLDGASASRGALLATAYCLGLGLPFLLVGLAYRRALGMLGAVRRHRVLVTRIGGGMLVAVGVLLASGAWTAMMQQVQGRISGFETVI
jgi:cytochrome c-type biogenesis protein